MMNSIVYPDFLNKIKKRKFNTVFCFIDLYKEVNANKASENKKVAVINKIYELEQQLLKTREISNINYFFSLKSLKLIVYEIYKYNKIIGNTINKKEDLNIKNGENECKNYYSFLIKLKNEI